MSSYVHLKKYPGDDIVISWLKALQTRRILTDSDMLVFIIYDLEYSITYQYQIMADCIKEHEEYVIQSRGQEIMPLIEKRCNCIYDTNSLKVSKIVQELITRNESIAIIENYTGGLFANEITNSKDAALIFKGGFVAYSESSLQNFVRDYVLAVNAKKIAKISSRKIREKLNANFGISIVGKLSSEDKKNTGMEYVSFSIDKRYGFKGKHMSYIDYTSKLLFSEEGICKEVVVREVIQSLYEFLNL